MRKPFLLSLLAALLTTLSLHAYEFQSGDLYYNITSDTTVKVTYKVANSYNYPGLTTATIPATVTYNGTTYSVTCIGDSAFYGCSSLTSIPLPLPNSVTSIGESAFVDCSSLTSIPLPNSVTSIGGRAFWGCSSLTSITIPNSVTSIGSSAFMSCESLTSIVVESGNTMYDSRENCNAIIETASNTLIAGGQSTTIPNSVTSIGEGAFYGCSSLTSITIPNSVTRIGSSAFSDVPNVVYSGTATGTPWGARSVNGYVDGYFVYADDTKTHLLACSAAATGEITLPNSVTSIGGSAFGGCSSLTSITIPNSVTSIGDYAFWGCTSLTSITIPNSVTSIGAWAFEDCSSLTSITSLSCTPPSCGFGVFYDTPSEKTLVVPSISMDAYKNSSTWKEFTSFESIVYPSITLHSSDSTLGIAQIDQDVDCDSVAIISAVGNPGSAFTQWSDGNTDNPRTIKLTQDTTLTAEFAPNQYTLTTTTNYAERGTAQGDTIADYLTELQVSATANYGYHFTQWSDGNTNNPRTISLTKDTNLVALFEKNQYTITTSCNAEQGTISGTKVAEYLDKITLNVLPNVGCHFTQWTDSNTDNPRTFTLTQDTTFAAEFAMDYSGKCGDELYWAYSNQEIKITGSGAMYNYTDSTMPWTLLRDSILTVRVGNNATSIGEYAFSNTPKLAELHIGTNVENIGANAFSGCRRLYDIYCNPTYPPFAETNSFANYNVYVHVPCASLDAYDVDVVFGSFKYVECIGSEDAVITDKTVTVVPADADATFTWPVTDNAETYSLVITKDGVTFCTLVFNAQGQLVSIAFKPRRQNAPAAEGTTPATYAEMTANGFRFTVTGLDEGAAYAYTLTVRNAANTVLETYTGDFTTLSNTPTGINESAGEDAHAHGQVEKIIRDGQVLILRNGVAYDMMGQTL